MNTLKHSEVVIIGGSYAGLSAAMALGRSLRNVLIIDSGIPCNRQTPTSHNFITNDGIKPSELFLKAKTQVLKYNTVTFLEDFAIKAEKRNNLFHIFTKTGREFTSKKIIFATGVKDLMPEIKGFSECWGISIVHCPYCHGYEIRNQKTGIIANGETALHLAALVSNLTKELTILTNGKEAFDSAQQLKLKKNNIKIIEKEISEIEHNNGMIKNIIFKDSSTEPFTATYASIPFTQHSELPEVMGCKQTEQGYIEIDALCKTTIEGVFACGDNSTRMRSVANAVAEGNKAGAMVNMELTQENF